MTWASCELGAHDWRPWGGSARYKCDRCYVIGYRPKALWGDDLAKRFGSAIVPYKCPKCKGPTTIRNKRCPACR